MKTNQKGFEIVSVLIVIVIVGLIGVIGWYVWDRQAKEDSAGSNSNQSAAITKQLPPESLDYVKELVPSEWSIETMDYDDGGYSFISLTNKDNTCFVGANMVDMSEMQTLEEQRTEYYKANRSPLKEGQKLTELARTSLEVKTKDGSSKTVEAQSIKGEAFGDVWYKKLAVVDIQSEGDVNTYARTIEVLCDTEEKLQSAESAIQYIKF